jgi:hypothetical protein
LSEVLAVYGYTAATAFGPLLGLHQSRGTPSAATATQSGDTIGGMVGWGFDGTGESQYPVGIRMLATENHGIAAHGTKVIFEVCANGATGPVTAMTLDQSGYLGVGVATPLAPVEVSGAIRALSATLVTPASGKGLELRYNSGLDQGVVLSFDRSVNAYKDLALNGANLLMKVSGTEVARITSTGFGYGNTPSYALDITGDSNTSGVFRKGGVAGISVTRSFGTSLTVNSVANGVIGTPGVGQSNTTLVTGVTLNVTSNTFSGGIITA